MKRIGLYTILLLMLLPSCSKNTGTTITVEATGKEAGDAVAALSELVSGGFGEED